jgi:hypothetical protein
MNRKVCEKCRRYGGLAEKPDTWWCGETIYKENSEFIPGHSLIETQDFHPMTKSRKQPPEWCERILEQTILNENEEADIEADKKLVYDGNDAAEFHSQRKKDRGWTPPPMQFRR